MPQETTGFTPFELLYEWEERGPLDILKESWEPSSESDMSVVSHVLQMREDGRGCAGQLSEGSDSTKGMVCMTGQQDSVN